MATNNEKLQELSVEEKLQHLYELQRIDTEIDKIKTLRGELPLEVQDLEDEIAGLETRLENLKNEISEADKSVTNKKQEITKSEELIKKYSEQLDNVRNNREYDALTKEVEFQKLEIELQQKRIREAQKLKAEKEVNLEISNKQYTEKKADLEAKKAELDDIIAETHKDEEALIKKSGRSVTMPATAWQSSPSTGMLVEVVSIKFRHSGNWISAPGKKSSCVSIADES